MMNENNLSEYLNTLTKDDIIELYLQKCFENELDKFELTSQKNDLVKQITKLRATNSVLSKEISKNSAVKQDCIETCCGIPIYEIPKLKAQLIIFKKALDLAVKYMYNTMCADDVPSPEWFVTCAENGWSVS